jgi:hypothetical protein
LGPRRGAGSMPRHAGSSTRWMAQRRCRVSSAELPLTGSSRRHQVNGYERISAHPQAPSHGWTLLHRLASCEALRRDRRSTWA